MKKIQQKQTLKKALLLTLCAVLALTTGFALMFSTARIHTAAASARRPRASYHSQVPATNATTWGAGWRTRFTITPPASILGQEGQIRVFLYLNGTERIGIRFIDISSFASGHSFAELWELFIPHGSSHIPNRFPNGGRTNDRFYELFFEILSDTGQFMARCRYYSYPIYVTGAVPTAETLPADNTDTDKDKDADNPTFWENIVEFFSSTFGISATVVTVVLIGGGAVFAIALIKKGD